MRSVNRLRLVLSVLTSLATASAAHAAECPSAAEVDASLTKWHTDSELESGRAFIWKIKGVSDFQFGAMKSGNIVKHQVEWGKSAQDVCPVRLEYSFVIETQDGQRKPQKTGVNQTFLFYKNGFDEWIFKTSN